MKILVWFGYRGKDCKIRETKFWLSLYWWRNNIGGLYLVTIHLWIATNWSNDETKSSLSCCHYQSFRRTIPTTTTKTTTKQKRKKNLLQLSEQNNGWTKNKLVWHSNWKYEMRQSLSAMLPMLLQNLFSEINKYGK